MKTVKHSDKSGRIWYHKRETGDGFPKGTWTWEATDEN